MTEPALCGCMHKFDAKQLPNIQTVKAQLAITVPCHASSEHVEEWANFWLWLVKNVLLHPILE